MRGPEAERAVAGIPWDRILALEGYPDGSETPVYLSGSVVTPLGNPWSDVDVYVLTDRRPIGPFAADGGTNWVSQHFEGDRRVDFEFWCLAHVQDLAGRLAGLELGGGRHLARALFTHIEECFLHRLRNAVPILNVEAVRAWQARFDFAKFAAYLAQETIRQTDAVHEDVCGMLEAGHLDVAALSARHLVGLSVDAYLHRRGGTDPVVKWRPRQLALADDGSAFHREVATSYWRLEFPEALRGDDAVRRYVEACLAFSRTLTSWAQS
jgi:hypothetical protein